MRQRGRLHRLRTRAAAWPQQCGQHAGRQHPGPSSLAAHGPRLSSTSLPFRHQAAPARRGRALQRSPVPALAAHKAAAARAAAPRGGGQLRLTASRRGPAAAGPRPSPPLPAARRGQPRRTLTSTSRPLFLKLLMRWFSKPGFSAMTARGSGGCCSCGGGGGGGESSGRGRRGRSARSVTPGARGGRGAGAALRSGARRGRRRRWLAGCRGDPALTPP